jgi:hypothetical protein
MNGESEMPLLREPDPEQEDDATLFDDVVRMADRLGLQGDKRSNYIDDHMVEAGYERIQTRDSYVRIQQQDDPREDSGRSRWFGGGRQQQQQGRDPRNPRQGRQNLGNDDTY